MTFSREPFQKSFYVGDFDIGAPPKTLRELEVMKLSAHLRSKLDWHNKIHNPEIIYKWSEEAKAYGLTKAQVDFVLEELKYYASLRDDESGIEASAVDGVWQSDKLIEGVLKEELRRGVRGLEDIPEAYKDWHPGSNKQVLDLVHPSLYCFVSGVTRQIPPGKDMNAVLASCGSGEIKPLREVAEYSDNYAYSSKYQWLPADLFVSESGDVTFNSYINNLHPVWHHELYSTISKIFSRFVPLFNRVLTDLRHPRDNRIEVDPYTWYDNDSSMPDDDDDEAMDDWYQNRLPALPDAPAYSPPSAPAPSDIVDLRNSHLQVIVKIANIELTPENPEYPGGTWHVEGMLNESIVASGIYYWSSENVTKNELSFRVAVMDPGYEQNDDNGIEAVYGLVNNGPMNQVLGSAVTQEDRCIAFPNTLQHRVSPFRLSDPTKPGHRKILVFFLVDPTSTILSTSVVPPQQQSWLADQLSPIPPFKELSKEVLDSIVDFSELMTLQEAKKHREELMVERKYFVSQNNEQLFEREFSLCEH
ncbi:hypothetical protein K493DRAFT_320815 [Basidiobolus meristosporus CBS 931.73]|uniref:Uncharacterized protein n=1 Tax=Basidiobolus meristosporus CBS 931.73 TaxID=1314790 RepID=A0A1Y1X579_9FUNG|nr:hypothetical protein K493DRAFT_320815 [Basidiobolus meristosporus CBS 931.73]|eukprot:ORX80805.1 hypothetical protein K493DRAFT_320815 [Basidiobolus meristosporus CBS 931.73]